jgi:hypothetical protein
MLRRAAVISVAAMNVPAVKLGDEILEGVS